MGGCAEPAAPDDLVGGYANRPRERRRGCGLLEMPMTNVKGCFVDTDPVVVVPEASRNQRRRTPTSAPPPIQQTTRISRGRWRRSLARGATMKRLVTPAALIAVLVCAAPALAHGSAVRVSGIQAAADTTAGAPGDPCAAVDPVTGVAPFLSNAMAGSLIGCWYTDTSNPIVSTPTGVFVATGAEHFVGCLDLDRSGRCAHHDPTGTLALTYKFEGKFDPATGNEVAGRCQHKIVSGTGDFAGATGRINFNDNVTNGTSNYRGLITLTDSPRVAPARAVAAAAAAVGRPRSMC